MDLVKMHCYKFFGIVLFLYKLSNKSSNEAVEDRQDDFSIGFYVLTASIGAAGADGRSRGIDDRNTSVGATLKIAPVNAVINGSRICVASNGLDYRAVSFEPHCGITRATAARCRRPPIPESGPAV